MKAVKPADFNQEWAKVPEAARIAGVSARLVRRWIAEGVLLHSRLPSGLVLIRIQDIDDFLSCFQRGKNISNEQKCKADALVQGIVNDWK